VSIIVFGLANKLLVVIGFQRETASRGSLGIYSNIVFAAVLERIFFSITPSVTSLIGALIIVGSALFVAVTKQKDEKSDTAVILHVRLPSDDVPPGPECDRYGEVDKMKASSNDEIRIDMIEQ